MKAAPNRAAGLAEPSKVSARTVQLQVESRYSTSAFNALLGGGRGATLGRSPEFARVTDTHRAQPADDAWQARRADRDPRALRRARRRLYGAECILYRGATAGTILCGRLDLLSLIY